MGKGFAVFLIGIIVIAAGVVLMAVPGAQGNAGGGGLMLFGAFLVFRGFRVMTKAPALVGTKSIGTESSRSETSRRGLFLNRRVITPQDSRPRLPFKL
ncbi:MAG: hypothetical protein CBC35_08625 [Planctomycetes bacterium TMED75]|nr:hypothetical protein [Planctomycetaceae bacterium]OUU91825.1 MAG: hypothetical protein CBC35_08625 [Planctomycetes bacterium TMED75]